MTTISIANASIQAKITGKLKNTLTDGSSFAESVVGGTIFNWSPTTGVSANNANRFWARTGVEITSGATVDIDLYDFAGIDIGGGAGKDALGQAMALEEICVFAIVQTAGPGRLEIMPANPANHAPWMPVLTVALGNALKSGGLLMLAQKDEDAFDVEDGSAHMIRLGANGGAVTYAMYVVGRTDDNESSSSSSSQSSSSASSRSSSSDSSLSSQSSSSP
jgi:hypothetical protein